MKIFEASRVREIDQYTIIHEPVESIDLMERAATRLTGWYVRHFKTNRKVVIFAGPGNNGGDAMAMARMLAERQFRVDCYILAFGMLSENCATNRDRLLSQGKVDLVEISDEDPLLTINPEDVVVDGIFGSGLSRKVTGFPARVIRHINDHSGRVIAIDIPSGLFGEDNTGNDYNHVIRADYTLSFQLRHPDQTIPGLPHIQYFPQEKECSRQAYCSLQSLLYKAVAHLSRLLNRIPDTVPNIVHYDYHLR